MNSIQFIECNEGRQPLFEQVFKKYRIYLIRYARMLVRDQFVAEDVVTDVFIIYWDKRNDFPNVYAVIAFLEICTKNACINYIRKECTRKKRERWMPDRLTKQEGSVLDAMTQSEMILEAWAIIDGLPRQCRCVIILCYMKGMSYRMVARRLGLSVHTVKNQKLRGLKLIRERFEKLNVDYKQAHNQSAKGKVKLLGYIKIAV